MDPAVLQRTQDSLGRVIRRPPLTERLLSKPPFRYLHDVISEVIRATGFMKGLYTELELKSDNVKDKDAKISFLQKAVDVVTIVLGEPLSVKPARVVAGHEPEKTNELLQAIGKCCLNKLSSEDAVRKVLAGERPDPKGKPPSTSKSQDKENRESREDERKSQKDREDRNASEIRDRSTSKERKEREHVKHEDRKRSEREHDGDKDALRDEKRDGDKNHMKPAKPEKDKAREKEREKGRDKERRSEGSKGKERDKDRPKEREKKGREEDKEPERDRESERRRDRTRDPERSERKSKSSEEATPKRPPEGPARETRTGANKELSGLPKNSKSSTSKGSKGLAQYGTDGRMNMMLSPYSDIDRKARRGLQPAKGLVRKEPHRRRTAGSGADSERGRKYPNMSAAGSLPDERVARAPGEQGEQMSSTKPLGALEAQGQERAHRTSDAQTAKVLDKKQEDPVAAPHGDSGSGAEGEAEKPSVTLNGETSEELPPHVTQRRIPRPNSARPAPPRVKRQGSLEVPPPERVGSGKVVPSVIVDKRKEDDDEDEQFVVEEAAPLLPEMPEMETDTTLELNGDEKHGGLVKKILETKKDYETPQQLAKSNEKLPLSETGRRKEKDQVSKEIEKLRTSIQTLCRSALPLGKIMDYIQEDMDAMQNELQTWRSENKVHADALLREQSITDSAVEPLRIELTELEQLIKEKQDKICAVKANILKNEEKIQKMVFSLSASSRT